MGPVRIPHLSLSHVHTNLSVITLMLLIYGSINDKFLFVFVTVQRSVFKRAARRRREEMRGAEEVHEDENTATELPVDQVSFTVLSASL